MSDLLPFKMGVLEILPLLSGPRLPVLMQILADAKFGASETSLDKIGIAAGVQPNVVSETLNWLANPIGSDGTPLPPLIVLKKGVIEVQGALVGEAGTKKIKLAKEGDPLFLLEQQNKQLMRQIERMKAGEECGLADELWPEEAAVVADAETVLGRSLTYREAWELGKAVQGYGPDRVKVAIDKGRHGKNPIRAALAMLRRGTQGQPAKQKDASFERVKYFEPTADYDPF